MASTAAAAGAAEADGTSDTVGLLSASTSATANGDGKQQQGPTTADGVPFDPKSLLDR